MLIIVIVITTFNDFYITQRGIRAQQGMNESIWTEQLNAKLQEEFNFQLDLPAVFIDTFHNREKQDEVDKFSENTQLLWAFAESKLGINYQSNLTGRTVEMMTISAEPFWCRDIQLAMSDIRKCNEISR